MKRENDEIADLFRSKLDPCELSVRDNFWEELEKDFPVQAARSSRTVHFRYAAVAAVFLALIGMSATLWLFAPKGEIEEAFTQVVATSERIKQPGRDAPGEMFAVTPQPLTPLNVRSKSPATSEYADDSVSISYSFSFSYSSELERETPDDMSDGRTLIGNGVLDANPVQQTIVAYSPEKRKGWTVGMYALAATSSMGKVGASEYKMPVSVGVSVSKQLTNRLSLETGVNYTMLRSHITPGNKSEVTLKQKAHYIGIPIKASYTIVDKKNVDLYLTGGGLLEKCVGLTGNAGIRHSKQMQYALTASAGVQYKIGRNIAVFAEPGIAYNFDNGASTPEIRKEKPLNFNLLCGVRVMY